MQLKIRSVRFCFAALTAAGLVSLALRADSSAPDRLFVRTKKSPVLSEWTQSVIHVSATDGRAKVWVFFTDKGFYDDRGFAAAVSQKGVSLPERASARRVKMGRERVQFLDIPVRDVYVERVLDLGATLRRTSRWLNAASFEIETSRLDSLAKLPFVHEIRPMVTYRRTPNEVGAPDGDGSGMKSGQAGGLNYGLSEAQLTQINVPAAHAAGYRGQGVRVCMMDTGYRKNHIAFASAYAEGRVIAEYDFIFNDGNTQDSVGQDQNGQHNHGTSTWSILGGEKDGTHYGPAFDAEFLLAKTEYVPTETEIEEDNWVAGMEWADGLGADVISSSLGYVDWYVTSNFNGDFCVTTRAADSAAVLGIVVCNAMGNEGQGITTLIAPADADSILAVGSVGATGTVSGFSSRGPTADGRNKPEVCALGEGNSRASSISTTAFSTSGSGTSYATPLVGGAAAVILSAHPTWTPMQVREALMMTASQAFTPDNNKGWGIIDVMAAINYDFCAEPGAPGTPFTTNPEPCANESYIIAWAPEPGATAYELYENAILIFDGPGTQRSLSHPSGNYTYSLKAKNACGAGVSGPVGGATNVTALPAAPNAPSSSTPLPCGANPYTVSWDAVAGADAYELYENDILVYVGALPDFDTSHASGSYSYHVIAKNACGDGPQSGTSETVSINVCPCHADPLCDGETTVLDVVQVVGEAFRGDAPVVDPSCAHASRSDLDCDCAVGVLDVVRMVNVTFRGGDPATEFCNACVTPCP